MRRAARTDGNHTLIARALEDAGCAVTDTSGAGDGFPDLFVSRRIKGAREMWLIEVKDPAQVPSKRRLTPAQKEFHAKHAGARVHVVETVDQALLIVGVV